MNVKYYYLGRKLDKFKNLLYFGQNLKLLKIVKIGKNHDFSHKISFKF